MMQPRNSRAVEGGKGRSEAVGAPACVPPLTASYRRLPPAGFVAASIPMANRNRLHPVSRRGSPEARSSRASA